MVKRSKQNWKPVALTESLITNGIDGLIGIEELHDYNIARGESLSPASAKRKKVCCETFKSKDNLEEGNISVTSAESRNSNIWTVEPLKQKIKKEQDKARKKKLTEKGVRKEQLKKKPSALVEEQNDEDTKDETLIGMEAWSSMNVPQPILKALSELNFKKPTEIQALTLLPALKGRRDIIGAAETGSGKTLAFGIPIIYGILQQKKNIDSSPGYQEQNRICKESEKETDEIIMENEINTEKSKEGSEQTDESNSEAESINPVVCSIAPLRKGKLYALILTPTRELAIQVRNHLISIAKYTDIKVAVVVGGLAPQKQERLLKREPEIVVATPGRLWEMIENGNPHLQHVSDISFLAIDETDRMLEKGHFQELQSLLERINSNEYKKRKRQNFVFSATLTLVHGPPKYVGKGKRKPRQVTSGQKLQQIISSLGITNPKIVDITVEKGTASTLTEARIVCPITDKDHYLYYFLLRHTGRTLVFCNSISCVRRLAQILEILQCKPYPIHANMQQRQRLKNLERFRDSPNGLLLATDVAARGLDIPNVEHVIHYQVPRTTENYIHRSGRTARAQKEGITILMMEPDEAPHYLRICKSLGRGRDLPDFPVDDTLYSSAKARVNIARQIDKLEHSCRRNNSQNGWFQKAAQEMDIILDEDDFPMKMSSDSSAQIKRQANALRRQLQDLLGKCDLPKSASLKYPSRFVKKGSSSDSAVKAAHENKKMSGKYVKINK